MDKKNLIVAVVGSVVFFLVANLNDAVVSAASKKKGAKYYLTRTLFTGSQTLNACNKDFHMASLWEIFDTTALRYDTISGATTNDSGSGPPAGLPGWIRTSGDAHNDTGVIGVDNCNAWTTDVGFGTIVRLDTEWLSSVSPNKISPWIASNSECEIMIRVWCVQD